MAQSVQYGDFTSWRCRHHANTVPAVLQGGLLCLPPSGDQRVVNAVRAAARASLAGGPGVEERLARKYARRWLLKARRAAARRRGGPRVWSDPGSPLSGPGGLPAPASPCTPRASQDLARVQALPGDPASPGGGGSPFAALSAQAFGAPAGPPACPVRSPFADAAAQISRASSDWGGTSASRSLSLPGAGSLCLGRDAPAVGSGVGLALGSGFGSGATALGAAGLGAWASGNLAPQAERAAAAAALEARGAYLLDPNPGSPGPGSPLSPASAAGKRGLLPRGGNWGSSGGPVRRQHSGRVRLEP